MQYRSDIDGLRAVAVLAVVFHHLGFARVFGGGFVGVDVFFVISGYLITGIVQGDVDRGRFGLAEFYNRRVRRIFPALFLVYAFCLVSSAVWLLPAQAEETGKDVLASLGFVSNVVFCHVAGYFDQTSKSSLLLHTWSLSVEEQFYVVLPLLLALLGKRTKAVRLSVLGAFAVASFGASLWAVRVEPERAFYLMHFRAWELLSGALLAQGAFPMPRQRWVADVACASGLALIGYAVVTLRPETPFPGAWAIPPVLGAALVLYAGGTEGTLTSGILGAAPLRGVGLVSYSLYLWHWPLLTLLEVRHGELSNRERALVAIVSLVVSLLSYRHVERPLRRKPYTRGARSSLRVALSAMAVVAVLAVSIPRAAARLRPSAESAGKVLEYLKYPAAPNVRTGKCFLTSGYGSSAPFDKDLCLRMVPGKKNVLVLGDSHAAHLWPGLSAAVPDVNFLQATASGCGAFIHQSGAPRCVQLFKFIFHEFLPTHHVDAILYHGKWTLSYLKDIEDTLAYLRPFADRVIMLGPPLEYDAPLPKLLSEAMLTNDDELLSRHRVAKVRSIDQALARRIRKDGGEYFSMIDAACPGGSCDPWAAPGVPMQYDYGHLTAEGAKVVAARLGRELFR